MKLNLLSVKLKPFAIVSLVLISVACKTMSTVQFQTLEAPEIVLPSDINSLAFAYRNQHYPADSVAQFFSITGVSVRDTVDYKKSMSLSCYEGFRDNISEYWENDSIPFIRLPRKMMPDTTRHFTPLNWVSVDSICRTTKSDALVVLEDIQAFNKHDIVEGDRYWAETEIRYYGIWRIYDPLYKKIYGNVTLVDSLFSETSDSDLEKLMDEKLPRRGQVLNDASYELGKSYVDFISPKWKDVTRTYFVSGDKRMSAALYFMNRNEFDTAINLWKNLIKEKNMKLAGRAAYNLAVVYEMKGDLRNARGWIRKSIYFYKMMKNSPDEYKRIEAYALVLNSRWVNGKRIKRFFGEE